MSISINRRRFLGGLAGALTAGSAVSRSLAPAEEPAQEPSPLVDTHQHLWDFAVLRPPWVSGIMDRSYTTDDYLAAAAGTGIRRAVYMEVDVADDQLTTEADYVLGLCRAGKTPTVAAVLGGRPWREGFDQYLDRFRDDPHFKGIRHIPRLAQPDVIPQPDIFMENLRLLGRRNLCFDICVPPQALADAAKIVDRCPETRFVLDHCGNADPRAFGNSGGDPPSHDPDRWRRDIEALARRENVVCKISGIVARVPTGWTPELLAPIVHHCLDSFGPDRVMFAGDWPVCTRGATLQAWVAALRQIVAGRSPADRQRLFHDNAVRFYGL